MSAPMPQKRERLESILRLAPVIAVVTIDDANAAVPLARALLEGGIQRHRSHPAHAGCAGRDSRNCDGLAAGGGRRRHGVVRGRFRGRCRAGAKFAVSPGATPALIDAAEKSSLPWLPGAATASEAMALAERGYGLQKFFPAQAAGGVDYLRSLGGPLPQIRFCPTGGITAQNALEYLRLPNVVCVGGSWLTPPALVNARDWPAITALARAAAALRG